MSERKVFLLVSSGRVTEILAQSIIAGFPRENFVVLLDQTTGLRKLFNLLKKNVIKLPWLLRQFIAQKRQEREISGEGEIDADHVINSAADLEKAAALYPTIDTLLAFRAGLVVNRRILEQIVCYNMHYARLPDYPGLGAVAKALSACDWDQEATVHLMSTKIDEGATVYAERYKLEPAYPYWQNELIAARAGAITASNFLRRFFDGSGFTQK